MGILDTLSQGAGALQNGGVSAFVIQEVKQGQGGLAGAAQAALAAAGGGAGRKLQLQGRGLPHRPFSLSTSQRITLTWLPGYSVATAQALGPKEEVTTIRGKWSDKYVAPSADAALDLGPIGNAFAAVDNAIGAAGAAVGLGSAGMGGAPNETIAIEWNGKQVETVSQAADYVDEFVRQAVLVDVFWGPQARRGYITKFMKDWHTGHDLEWEMEFTWISRTEPNPPVTVAELSMGDTASLFQALADALGTEALPPTFPMANDVLADVNAGITRIATTTQAVVDTVKNIKNLALAPYNVARGVMALSDTLRGQVDELIGVLTQFPSAGLRSSLSGSDTNASAQTSARPSTKRAEASATASQSMAASEYVKRVTTAAKKLKALAIQHKDDLASRVERQVAAIVTAREGEDLRDIATRFYGSPNDWKRIASANGLTSARLTAGVSLAVPRLTSGEGC